VLRAHVVISGRVQGVFFRHEAAKRARRSSVGGWIRNRSDGQVEALFEGPDQEVESMVEWCRTGPPHARVDEIEVTREPIETLENSDFRTR
jgi:acylphosphatase